jgi:hypothetical protein
MKRERNGILRFEHLDDTSVNIVESVNSTSRKMVGQAFPNLWPMLHADLKCNEPLPDELAELLRRRLYEEAFDYVFAIQIQRMRQVYLNDPQLTQIAGMLHAIPGTWERAGSDTPLVRRVYGIFLRQLMGYRKKYKEDISQTIAKAKGKNAKAICRLLEWDKSWIIFDFIQNEISFRGYLLHREGDKRFLEMVGGAIARTPGVRKYAEKSGYLSAIELLSNLVDLSGNNNKLLRKIHSRLVKEYAFDSGTEEEGDPLADFKYFTRYLKRHNIL